MNTDPKNHNPIRALSHPEQLSTDTNTPRKYEVRFFFEQISSAFVTIEANSLTEAEEQAGQMEPAEIEGWERSGGKLWVDSVEPLDGGQDNE